MTAAETTSAEPESRRERKKRRTRAEIYASAMRLFGGSGFEAVTVEQICTEADVARATFFAHFPTKASLLLEFNREVTAAFQAKRRMPRPGAVEELRQLCAFLSDRWLERADVMGFMVREFLASPAALLEAGREQSDLADLIVEIVARGQAEGALRPAIEARLAAAVFLSTSLSILSGAVFAPGEKSPDEVREQFLELLLGGLVDESA